MEPQDTPPYAPLESTAPRPTRAPSRRPAPATPDRTRRNVGIAAVAAFLVGVAGMAAAHSGDASSTTATTPGTQAPQQSTFDDEPAFPSFGDGDSSPRAAQPATPFPDGAGQTQSGGS